MKKELDFTVPFSGFCGTTFINCFASTYLFLEEKDNLESCEGGSTLDSKQECYFFLFDTMCGRSALRCRFDGEATEMEKMIGDSNFYEGGTDDNVDFLFGFGGYDYRKVTNETVFKEEIISSIDEGKPIIARVKDGNDRFRVITGYDMDVLICPDFSNAQNKPQGAPSYDELEALYIIGDKIRPRYLTLDGLKRIKKVMEYNMNENLWGSYTEKMGLYTSDSLNRCSQEEKKARMKRVADTMWHTFNCHNFAEVFRKYCNRGDATVYQRIGDMNKLCDPQLIEVWDKISNSCGYTHDLAWALIGLEACADWKQHAAGYFGEMVELTISQIADNDKQVLEAIKRAISILE